MQKLLLVPFIVSFFLLFGCNAPEKPTHETRLTVLSPWDAQEDGKPILKSLESPLSLSYLLADNALVSAEDYIGRARFRLLLNGVDITTKQQPDNPDGFSVSNVGSGGAVKFPTLQPLESALISGENTLTLQPIKDNAGEVSVQFIFFGQSPQVVVKTLMTREDDSTLGQDEYRVHMSVMGDTPLKNLGYDKSIGKNRYAIRFYDQAGQEVEPLDLDVSADGREIQLMLKNYPDVSKFNVEKADFRYELTDALGREQKKGFVLNGRTFKDFMGMQINNSTFNAFTPVLSTMFESILDEFTFLLGLVISSSPKDADANDVTLNGSIRAPQPLSGTEDFVQIACEKFLTKAQAANKRCAFYASIRRSPAPTPRVGVGFHQVENKDNPDHGKPKLHFDLIFDTLMLDIEIVAYDMAAEGVYTDPITGTVFNDGIYLGSFKTTIVFKDLAMRDTLAIGQGKTPYQACKQANPDGDCDASERKDFAGELIAGLTASEGYSFRSTNDFRQKIAEWVSDTESNYNPELIDSSCPGDICFLEPGAVQVISNFGALPVRTGMIEAIEVQLNEFLPDIVKSLVLNFPDISGLRTATTSNTAEQVVDAVKNDGDQSTHELVRQMAADYAGIKNLNLLSFWGIGANYAGQLKFSGGYRAIDQDKNLLSQQYVTPFVQSTGFSDWHGADITVKYTDPVSNEEKTTKHQVDAVAGFNLNAINQYLAASFQLEKAKAQSKGEDQVSWLSKTFDVDTGSEDVQQQTLSLIAGSFNNFISSGDEARLEFNHARPPEVSFVGSKDSKWAFGYSFLFGLINGEKIDPRVLPSVKIDFNEVDIQLFKMDGAEKMPVFKVNANLSIEFNIRFDNGLPKLYVRTPKNDKAIVNPINKRMVFLINRVEYLNPATVTDASLLSLIGGGYPTEDNQTSARLKVQVASKFVGAYQDQISDYLVDGVETFFDQWVEVFLKDEFSKVVNFNDYTCDDLKVNIIDLDPNQSGETQKHLAELFGASDPLLVQGHIKWFTTDELGVWLNMGIDFTSALQASGKCPDPMPPLGICFTNQSLEGEKPACRHR